MRIITNENISGTVIRLLRESGHDVVSVKESLKGASDATILKRAQADRRLLITHDKDFGELAFRFRLPAESGVVVFRLSGRSPEADSRRILEVLEARSDWAGHFTVVDEVKIRMRPLPPVLDSGRS